MIPGEEQIERSISFNENKEKSQNERIDYLIFCMLNKIEEKGIDFLSDTDKKILKVALRESLKENIDTMKRF